MPDVFKTIISQVGDSLCADDITISKAKMDVARLLIRTKELKSVSEDVEVAIIGLSFIVRLLEDDQSPLKTLSSGIDNESEDSENCSISETGEEAKLWHEVGDDAQMEDGEITCYLVGRLDKRVMLEDIEAHHALLVIQKGDILPGWVH